MNYLYKEQRSKGIVLRAALYKGRDRMITVFMEKAGMINLLVKKAHQQPVLTSPFAKESLFMLRRSLTFINFKMEQWSKMVTSFELLFPIFLLQVRMVHALLHSQMPAKPEPKLYFLLSACMKQLPLYSIPSFASPQAFGLNFWRMKESFLGKIPL